MCVYVSQLSDGKCISQDLSDLLTGGGNSSQVLQPRLGGKADETIFALNQSISKLLSRVEVEVINQNDDQREGSDNVQLGIKTI